MIYQESQRVRRIVGRLDEGEEIIEELSEFCRDHGIDAAEIRGVGRLDRIELVRFDPDLGDYREVFSGEGHFDLLNLNGNVAALGDEIAVRLQAVVSAEGPVAPQVVAGQLRAGRAEECEFVLEVFDDLELERRLDNETGLLSLQAIKKKELEEPSDAETGDESFGGQSMKWEEAADAARQADSRQTGTDGNGGASTSTSAGASEESSPEEIYGDMDLDEPVLEPGDILDHSKLGRCRVMKVEDDKYAHIRMPRGKIRKLSLDILDMEYQGEEGDRNVFKAQVNK